MLKERAGASTSLQAVCSRGSIPARTPAGSPELRTLGASVVLTAVDTAGAMSRGWERKKAKLFEHYFRLWLEQVASPLPSLPLPRCESHEKAFDGGSDDKTTFCRARENPTGI